MSRRTGAGAALTLAAFLPYRLSIASNAVSRLIAAAYQEAFGLTIPEWRLIAVLHEDPAATQQDLVGRTLMDKVAVSRAAQGLERRGLVRRAEDAADGRVRRLSLTSEGETLYAAIAPVALAYERRLMAAFSADEARQLGELLDRLQAAAGRLADEDIL